MVPEDTLSERRAMCKVLGRRSMDGMSERITHASVAFAPFL